jgi:hypothetical protein
MYHLSSSSACIEQSDQSPRPKSPWPRQCFTTSLEAFECWRRLDFHLVSASPQESVARAILGTNGLEWHQQSRSDLICLYWFFLDKSISLVFHKRLGMVILIILHQFHDGQGVAGSTETSVPIVNSKAKEEAFLYFLYKFTCAPELPRRSTKPHQSNYPA